MQVTTESVTVVKVYLKKSGKTALVDMIGFQSDTQIFQSINQFGVELSDRNGKFWIPPHEITKVRIVAGSDSHEGD